MFKLIFELLFFSKKNQYLSEKAGLLQKSKNNIMEDLDLFNILRRLQELEKLKNLLFSIDQRNIFNFCPKPKIINYKNDESFKSYGRKSFKLNLLILIYFIDINWDIFQPWILMIQSPFF